MTQSGNSSRRLLPAATIVRPLEAAVRKVEAVSAATPVLPVGHRPPGVRRVGVRARGDRRMRHWRRYLLRGMDELRRRQQNAAHDPEHGSGSLDKMV